MPNPRFKLFHDASLRSSQVKWPLHELVGDNFALEYVNIYGGERYSTDYLAINPQHAVPTLEITRPAVLSITYKIYFGHCPQFDICQMWQPTSKSRLQHIQ